MDHELDEEQPTSTEAVTEDTSETEIDAEDQEEESPKVEMD